MRVMVFVPDQSEAGALPTTEQLAEMGRFNESLARAGVLLAADGLQPTSKGARVVFDGPRPTVTDGPFAESKELIAGYWIWQVKSLDEAIEWASRAPFGGGVAIEIRPIFEQEDFGEALTPELRQQQARLRATMTDR
jgi:hypothetical protein